MFNLGFSEMIFLGVIALIVIGPKQLPEVARVVARTLNEFKRATAEITQPFNDLKNEARDMADKARSSVLNTEDMIHNTEKPSTETTEESVGSTETSVGLDPYSENPVVVEEEIPVEHDPTMDELETENTNDDAPVHTVATKKPTGPKSEG